MTTPFWKQEGPRAFSRVTDDGWAADVWKPNGSLVWRYGITDPLGNTTVSLSRETTSRAAKVKASAWMARERAARRNAAGA